MSQPEYDRRTFFACEFCDLVYAGLEKPDECRVCDGEIFIEVIPEDDPHP
ncbi:hypothetical protein [Saliphagus sp. LR7]|nr:hypothetical protein [Saliphagus sp. LR7]